MSVTTETYMDLSDEFGDARRDLFAKIARLYYVEDMNQRQIAEQLNISVASVSRALSKAKDLNIVRISIEETREEFHKIEIELERRYNVRECMVAGRFDSRDDMYADMASMATGLLARLLKRDDVLGIGWGSDLRGLAQNIGRASVGRIDIVPAAGTIEHMSEPIQAGTIADALHEHIDSDVHTVQIPSFAASASERNSLMRNSDFSPIRRLWNRLDTVILNVEPLDGKGNGFYTPDQQKELKALGGVCVINGSVLDADGALIENPFIDNVIAVELDEIRHVRNVVLVATGAASAKAVRAAIAAEFAHVLLLDIKCAEAL